MTSRSCIHYVSKSGRPSRSHKTEKGQSSSQFPRRVVLKNVLTIRQLHSSPRLVRSCLKSCMLSFSSYWSLGLGILGSEKSGEVDEYWGSGHTDGIRIHTVGPQCWRTWSTGQCIIAKTRLSSCCWTRSSGGFLAGSLFWIMGCEQLGSRLI